MDGWDLDDIPECTNPSPNKKSSASGSAQWNEQNTNLLAAVCAAVARKGYLINGSFNRDGWRHVVERFNRNSNNNYTLKQIRHKFLQLKKEYSLYKTHIQNQTGLGWTDDGRRIRMNDDWWKETIKDCIGAIDGTHIPCVPPRSSRMAYMGRKRSYTQNVLCICDFNLCFTYIEAGWEGSVHDARMLRECMNNDDFPHPAPNKYYLVDAGFPNIRGYLAPFRGRDTRYWHQEFRNAPTEAGRRPCNANEKFNYLHSTCRIIIERTFGIWKKRFKILSSMPSYHIDHQRDFVIATAALHNYIRHIEPDDDLIEIVNEQLENEPIDSDPPFIGNWDGVGAQSEDRNQWEAFRAMLRQQIVEQFQ